MTGLPYFKQSTVLRSGQTGLLAVKLVRGEREDLLNYLFVKQTVGQNVRFDAVARDKREEISPLFSVMVAQ